MTAKTPDKPTLTTDQTLLLQLAATIYAKPTMTSLEDAYQIAKHLVELLLNDISAPQAEAEALE